MVLKARRLIRNLAAYHYITIVITILLPALLPLAIPDFNLGFALKVILTAGAFLVWSAIAVLAVASMLDRDRTRAERLVNEQARDLQSRVSTIAEGQQNLRIDLRQEVDNLEETVRETLRDELGVVLPPRVVLGRATAVRFSFTASAASGTASGGSKVARLRLWFRRVMGRIWGIIYGRPEDDPV